MTGILEDPLVELLIVPYGLNHRRFDTGFLFLGLFLLRVTVRAHSKRGDKRQQPKRQAGFSDACDDHFFFSTDFAVLSSCAGFFSVSPDFSGAAPSSQTS